MIEMRKRPILFSAEMVRAILEGRKTQTRRIVKRPKTILGMPFPHEFEIDQEYPFSNNPVGVRWSRPGESNRGAIFSCPHGQPGDRLWVRESCWLYGCWQPESDYCSRSFHPMEKRVAYQATDQKPTDGLTLYREWRGTSSIHMPRWASRIDLEITGVRVGRLQEISRGDCMAEGCPFPNMQKGPNPQDWFADLWKSLHGPESWAANPWVWVIEFRRIKP